jgi:hypothetical protein
MTLASVCIKLAQLIAVDRAHVAADFAHGGKPRAQSFSSYQPPQYLQ